MLAGAVESVRMHLRSGTDLDATDTRGRSALILAASRGHLDICKVLLEAGADPTTHDNAGNDALAMARSHGETTVAELLHRARVSAGEFHDEEFEINRDRSDEEPLNGRLVGRTVATYTTTEEIAAGAAGGAGKRSHADDRASVDDKVAEPSADYIDAFDLSVWQEEPETEAPPDDPSCVREATSLQDAVSRHRPIDTDENWDDVEIDLPELEYLGQRRSPARGGDKNGGAGARPGIAQEWACR